MAEEVEMTESQFFESAGMTSTQFKKRVGMTPLQFTQMIGFDRLKANKEKGLIDKYMQWMDANPGKWICVACGYHGDEIQGGKADSCPKCHKYLLMRTVPQNHPSKTPVLEMRPGAA